jgi:hypothetical protein
MTKEDQSMIIWAGQTMQVTVNVDAAGSTTAQSLTGATMGAWISSNEAGIGTDAAIIFASTDMSLVSVDGTNDGIRFTILDSDSADMAGQYFYEVWAKDTSNNVAPVTTGVINVQPATGSL